MPQTDLTTDEVLDSLTGHEELWIADQFGKPVSGFILDPGMYRRILMFIVKRREGVNENDARKAVMDMQLKDVLEFFATEGSEDAVESGKDESQDEQQPATSSTSVS